MVAKIKTLLFFFLNMTPDQNEILEILTRRAQKVRHHEHKKLQAIRNLYVHFQRVVAGWTQYPLTRTET